MACKRLVKNNKNQINKQEKQKTMILAMIPGFPVFMHNFWNIRVQVMTMEYF